jgi:asparagine N-glycosylation enzyme membrane subunit Stt3
MTTLRAALPRWAERLALVALLGLTVGVRCLALPDVFVDGETILRMDDSQYHARRAAYSFVHFPAVLESDSYLNYPTGADVPWPPLYDLALGFIARLFASDVEQVPGVIAWVPVVLGGLTALLIYAVARNVGNVWEAFGAVLIFALLPASTIYSELGNVDHHSAVALVGTALLALHTKGAQSGVRRLAAVHVGLVAARLAMLLLWHGSLLYLALAEITAVVVLAGTGRRKALRAEGFGAAATALLVAPFVLGSEPGLGGPFSPIELSWLHVTALLGVAAAAFGTAGRERSWPAASISRRLLRLAAVGGAAALCFLLVPGLTEGLDHARGYALKQTAWIAGNAESQPIFAKGSTAATFLFGGFALLVPLSPLGPLLRARVPALRASALVLVAFTAVFGALAISQSRYANDFAPAGSVALVLLLSESGRFLARWVPRSPRWVAGVLPALAGLLLAWPLISAHGERVPRALAAAQGAPADDHALRTPHATVHRFAKLVREATPETRGYFEPDEVPEYGVLSFAGIGHVFQRVARRPTPSDNFGPYLADSNLTRARRFYELTNEKEAVASAEKLGWRYVVTAAAGKPRRGMLLHRLHWADGTTRFGAPPLEQFRLVTEGPPSGVSIGNLSQPRPTGDIPYKLFEIVPGAILQVPAEPGSQVSAELAIRTPSQRRFTYRASAEADALGTARLRVPYATETETPVRPLAPYVVRAGGRAYEVVVSDVQVREGAVIDVAAE